nr:hypothetical protein [Tanacetum cinerariifolium]
MKESIRRNLKFNDAEGTACLPNGTIFAELARTGRSNIAQAKEIANLKKRVKKLEKRRKSRPAGLRRLKKVGSSKEVESFKEKDSLGKMHDADMFGVDDLESNEVIVEKEFSTLDPVTTNGEVVTAASVEDSVAPTTTTTDDVDDELTLTNTLIEIKEAKLKVISTTITTPRAKGIVFHKQVQAQIPTVSSSKNKCKAKMIEPKKPLKKKGQIALDEEVAIKLEAKMRAKIKEEERVAREKDEANKALSIEDRSKLLAELIESRRKYFAAKRAEEIRNKPPIKQLKQHPLSSKSPTIVDYKIYREGKKSNFKIIRVDENSQNYLAFGTMFKNFNIEDLEVLRSIVKERFNKTKPVDDMENLLFQTLKTMFEPHVEDIIWKYQQGAVKVNNWKLFDSCGVYYVTIKNMVCYLLVEKMYPFTNNILHQLWSDVRL